MSEHEPTTKRSILERQIALRVFISRLRLSYDRENPCYHSTHAAVRLVGCCWPDTVCVATSFLNFSGVADGWAHNRVRYISAAVILTTARLWLCWILSSGAPATGDLLTSPDFRSKSPACTPTRPDFVKNSAHTVRTWLRFTYTNGRRT
jgi:hypothetical protein